MNFEPWEAAKVALFVAHPGHELRVFHWLERVRPRVYVLTDGSGRTSTSRLSYTSDLLQEVGAEAGCLYGCFRDRQLYDLLLTGQHGRVLKAAQELADDLVRHEIEWVFGDATEGYNPAHDLCRVMIGAAICQAGRRLGRPLHTMAFPLHASPVVAPPGYTATPVRLELTADAYARKLAVARRYQPLSPEVNQSLDEFPQATFGSECFWPTDTNDGRTRPAAEKPWYESYAEGLVGAGHYQQIIRFEPHVRGLVDALWQTLECGRAA